MRAHMQESGIAERVRTDPEGASVELHALMVTHHEEVWPDVPRENRYGQQVQELAAKKLYGRRRLAESGEDTLRRHARAVEGHARLPYGWAVEHL